MEKYLASIKNLRQNGDAVEIGKVVNQQRVARGDEKISPAYVRAMLNGNRKMTEEVKAVAEVYYKIQQEKQEELNQAFAN